MLTKDYATTPIRLHLVLASVHTWLGFERSLKYRLEGGVSEMPYKASKGVILVVE